MPDIQAVAAAFTGIKTAIDIAQAIRTPDATLEKAQTKLQFAELSDSLADAKMGIADVLDEMQQRDEYIAELKQALEFKAKLVRRDNGFYYEQDSSGKSDGDPYCPHCWEVDTVVVHTHDHLLHARAQDCPRCKTHFPVQ